MVRPGLWPTTSSVAPRMSSAIPRARLPAMPQSATKRLAKRVGEDHHHSRRRKDQAEAELGIASPIDEHPRRRREEHEERAHRGAEAEGVGPDAPFRRIGLKDLLSPSVPVGRGFPPPRHCVRRGGDCQYAERQEDRLPAKAIGKQRAGHRAEGGHEGEHSTEQPVDGHAFGPLRIDVANRGKGGNKGCRCADRLQQAKGEKGGSGRGRRPSAATRPQTAAHRR